MSAVDSNSTVTRLLLTSPGPAVWRFCRSSVCADKKMTDSREARETKKTESEDPWRIPAPTRKDFDDEVPEDERKFCIERFSDLNVVKHARMHCTACGTHLGLAAHNANRLRMHPKLRTLICCKCQEFYNSGEFDKGEDGSELYCRWCGQGGQVYCCSSCPVVFCQKCIRRNFGMSRIDDIESIDDWSCFICNPKTLWCHRAALWAARRYCFWKNKLSLTITDSAKRIQLQKECQIDESGCCKKKLKNQNPPKAKPIQEKYKPVKIGSAECSPKETTSEKSSTPNNVEKAIKRLGSPVAIKKVSSQPSAGRGSRGSYYRDTPPPLKKILTNNVPTTVSKFNPATIRKYTRKPSNLSNLLQNGNFYHSNLKFPHPPTIHTDNINLSLENLTQGLDVSQLNSNINCPPEDESNVICTPDFPLPIEPLCNLIEDMPNSPGKIDDDVQIITPAPIIVPKPISALTNPMTGMDLNPFNVIQMTEKDVSINKVTGGLKFRIDPSTLSSTKTYKLPDGRVFSVNPNPNMPGGYSATIVTINESQLPGLIKQPELTLKPSHGQMPIIQGSQLMHSMTSFSKNSHSWTIPVVSDQCQHLNNSINVVECTSSSNTFNSNPKLKYPIPINSNINKSSTEWFSYSLYEAVDLMTYVNKRLKTLKKEHPANLRGKSISEIEQLHYILDKLLKISCQRFTDLRSNLNKEFDVWLKQNKCVKSYNGENVDNVLSDFINRTEKSNDEPIFIDENSNDSLNPVIVNKDAPSGWMPSSTPRTFNHDDPLKNIDTSQIKIKKISMEKQPTDADVEDVLSFSWIMNNRSNQSMGSSEDVKNNAVVPAAKTQTENKGSVKVISDIPSTTTNDKISNLINTKSNATPEECVEINEIVNIADEPIDKIEKSDKSNILDDTCQPRNLCNVKAENIKESGIEQPELIELNNLEVDIEPVETVSIDSQNSNKTLNGDKAVKEFSGDKLDRKIDKATDGFSNDNLILSEKLVECKSAIELCNKDSISNSNDSLEMPK